VIKIVDLKVGDKLLKNIELIIFDKDGTLIDLYKYWSQMIQWRAEKICSKLNLGSTHSDCLIFELGVDTKNKRLRPNGPVGLKKREIVLNTAVEYLSALGLENTYDVCFDSFSEIDTYSCDKLSQLIVPLPNLYELFAALKENNCKIAIATTDRFKRAVLALKHLCLLHQTDLVVGVDSVQRGKPDPEMVNLITEKLEVPKSRTVVVGDALTDIRMGINSEVAASIGVSSGLTRSEKLSELTEYVINNLSELNVNS